MSFADLSQPDQIRLQRIAEHAVQCGPRAVAEALAEALAHGDLDRLEAYRRLTPELLDAAGGMGFPPRALVVPPADLIPADDGEGREVA